MPEEQQEVEELETENVEELETIEGEEGEIETEEGEIQEEEEWQKEVVVEDSEDDKPKPEKSLKAKKKLKGLLEERETELTEQQKENERLRLENEELKAGPLKNQGAEKLKRPLKEDFEDEYGDVDLDKYRESLDDYDDARYEQRTASKKVARNAQLVKDSISEGVESHKARATELVESSGLSVDKYNNADRNFVNVIEEMAPGRGKIIADQLKYSLGKGSERTIYFAGNNDAILDKVSSLLRKDPTCMSLMAYLGAENARLRGVTSGKLKSKAPAPAATADGNISTVPGTVKDSRLKKQYDAAHKKNDDDAAWDIRKEARASGVDVSSW